MRRILCVLLMLTLLTAALPAAADELVIPSSTLTIESEAFKGIAETRVILPEGIHSIGPRAFADSAVKDVNLPSSLTYIAPDAFSGCEGLAVTAQAGSYAHSYGAAQQLDVHMTGQSVAADVYNGYETLTREMETFCPQYTSSAADLNVLTNCIDCLLTNGVNGALLGAAAKEWHSPDGGKTWVFTLNDGMTWVDHQGRYQADVTAEDFAWSFEWVLNKAKNEGFNTGMLCEMLEGAQEYYSYTASCDRSEAEALGLEKFYDTVGFSVSSNTITMTCVDQLPYFPSVLTFTCFGPVSGRLLAQVGVEGYRGITYDQLWYNGPYTVTEFEFQKQKVLSRNPSYYNGESKLFSQVVIHMVSDANTAFEQFQTGLVDNVTLNGEYAAELYNNPSDPNYQYLQSETSKYSYQMHFNYDKRISKEDQSPDTAWNTAVGNEDFRLALYYGMDLTPYFQKMNGVTPQACQNYAYTARNVAVTSDGRDYVDLVLAELGLQYDAEAYLRYNAEKAAEYKARAIQALTEAGVSLPVKAAYYIIANSSVALENAEALKACMEAQLSDLVELEIRTYSGSMAQNVRIPRVYSFIINGWGADYGDPANFLDQETAEEDAYYTQFYSFAEDSQSEALKAQYDEFTGLVSAARAITDDHDARYAALAKAEAYLVQHALTIPVYTQSTWTLSRVLLETKINASYGSQNNRYVNWTKNVGTALD